jgi:hypothetical protein
LTQAFLAHVRADRIEPEQIVCLSFFPANAETIRRILRPQVGERLPWVTTVQRFLTLLLRDYATAANLPARAKEIDAVTRSLVIQRSWTDVGGPIWREFGKKPGAARELTKVIDWISQNRSRFDIAPGELGEHELSKTYCRYIELCLQHRLLTFQEASLRGLDLLTDPGIAAVLRARFPVVLVDDLHLARPDQLAFLSRMRGVTTAFYATGWLNQSHAAPELRYLWEAIQEWGGVESLPPLAPHVNLAIVTAVARLGGMPKLPNGDAGRPITLAKLSTVEDEMHAVAQAIVRALLEDKTLLPAEIVVVAAEAALQPFVQRVLARYGLPVAPLRPSPLHTPLLRGGILALRWKIHGADAEVERELMTLPYVNVDAIEVDALYQAALAHETSILGLADIEITDKTGPLLSSNTKSTLQRLKGCLTAIDVARLADGAEMAVRELGGLQWAWESAQFSESQRDAWIHTYTAWLARVRELQETAQRIGAAPEDMLGLIESMAATAEDDPADGLIQLVDSTHVNGVRGRLAFVVGLSESAAPVRHALMQLVADTDLRGLFADGRPVVLPSARDQRVWIEREARTLAAVLSRGYAQLHISLSDFSADGEVQLPSPFFERLLGPDGALDRHGNIAISQSSMWTQASRTAETGPESGLPLLDSVPAPEMQHTTSSLPLLDEHTFSASQIRMYLACPLQFFYGRILRIEVEEPGVFNQGSLMHEVLCATVGDGRLERVDLSGRGRPAWLADSRRLKRRVSAAFKGAWAGGAVDLPGGGQYTPTERWSDRFEHELPRRAVQRWAEQALMQWAEYESEKMAADGERQPILLEVPFTMAVGRYQVRGRIDRIDAIRSKTGVAYEVIDYKTGKSSNGSLAAQTKKFLPEAGEEPTDFQLPLYGLAVMHGLKGFSAVPKRLSYIFLDSLERGKRGDFSDTAMRTLRLEAEGSLNRGQGLIPLSMLQNEITEGVIQTMNAMSVSPYPAKPEFHCNWCGFRAACDRGRAQANEGA